MTDPGEPPADRRVRPPNRATPAGDSLQRPDGAPYEGDSANRADRGPEGPAAYPGSELIGFGTAREILHRILEGDPLGLSDRARGWLDANAFLMDSNRLALRTMAHVAHSARHYRGSPPLHDWVELLLERSVRELINEDREADRASRPVEKDEIAPYAFLADSLGIEQSLARRACVTFNGMEEYDRRAFYATSVMGKSMYRHVSEGYGPPARAEAALQRVLRRLSSIDGMPGPGK